MDILKGILEREKQIESDIKEGKRIRYRNREEIEAMKSNKSGTSSNTWFLQGSHTSVLNVPSTPGGALASKLRKAIGRHKAPDGGTTKIVESGGSKLTAGMTAAKSTSCPYPDKCSADGQLDCTTSKVIYQIECGLCKEKADDFNQQAQADPQLLRPSSADQQLGDFSGPSDGCTTQGQPPRIRNVLDIAQPQPNPTQADPQLAQLSQPSPVNQQLDNNISVAIDNVCDNDPNLIRNACDVQDQSGMLVVKPKRAIYTGITGYSYHKRLREHQKCISDNNLKNAMAKHKHQEHPSETDIKLESRILRGGIMENLNRYIGEALEIEASNDVPDSVILNSRCEWGHNPLSRLTVDRGK